MKEIVIRIYLMCIVLKSLFSLIFFMQTVTLVGKARESIKKREKERENYSLIYK